ncbi:MAG: response regulator [Thermodesulfobacteriota bacterium]
MKGRVLVIDDDAGIRRELTAGLTREGYGVVACPDGISAIHELDAARGKGLAFDHLVTDIFMPDIDGLKILKVIKTRHPDLPVVVIAGPGDAGDEALRLAALSESNTAYLERPFTIPDLVRNLEELSPGAAVLPGAEGTEAPGPEMRESVTAYLTIRVADPVHSADIFRKLYRMNGVQRCEAVRGDFDIIVIAQGDSQEEIRRLKDAIAEIDGVQLLSASGVERPKLDRDVNEFVDAYSKAVKTKGLPSSSKRPGTTSYIIVDVDKDAIRRIFTTVFFIDEVVFCDVVEDGARLVGMVMGHGAVGAAPGIVEKLGGIDGVLRVREAAVVKLVEE